MKTWKATNRDREAARQLNVQRGRRCMHVHMYDPQTTNRMILINLHSSLLEA